MGRTKVVKNISYDDIRKLYYVTFNYGQDNTGKNIKKTKTYKSLTKAKQDLKLFEADKTKQNIIMPTEDTLSDYINYWMTDIKEIKCESTTLYGYKNIANNHIIPVLGKYKIQDITTTQLNKYFSKKIKSGLSKNTVRKHYNLLKDVFKQAEIEDKIMKNPVNKIEPIKVIRKEQNVYTVDQLQTLLNFVRNQKIEIAIMLAGMLGLRREEVSGLKWENVDLENKEIHISEVRTSAGKDIIVKDTKNQSSHRILSILDSDDIVELLIKIKEEQDHNMKLLGLEESDYPYVLCKNNGESYNPNYISNTFKEILDKNNLPHIRFHDLRHTFASIANDMGVSLFDISKALGHSEPNTTGKIYTHMFDKTNSKAINKVAQNFNKKSKS